MKVKSLIALLLALLLLSACAAQLTDTGGSAGSMPPSSAETTPDASSAVDAGTSGEESRPAETTGGENPVEPTPGSPEADIAALIGAIGSGNGLLWYQFEEKAGATKLFSSLAQARDSIEVRATLVPDGGVSGGAVVFNGSSDRVKLNNDFSNLSQITPSTFLHPSFTTLSVAFYFMPERLTGNELLYEQGDEKAGLAIGLVDGQLVAAVAAGRSATGQGSAKIVGRYTVPENRLSTWIHVAVTFDGNEKSGTARLFVDGQLIETSAGIGAVIPQTLDAAGIGAAVYGTNALGLSGAYFKGRMDDLRIYSTALQPMGALEKDAVYLQSAAAKNAYLKASYEQLISAYSTEPALRGWVFEAGLSGDGVSLRLTGTDKYILAEDGGLAVRSVVTQDDRAAATFTALSPLAVPSWGEAERDAFLSLATADGRYLSAHNSAVSLVPAPTNDSAKLAASFKKTGDQTAVIEGLKGAVYYPSYALNAPQFWKWYDSAIIDRDMAYAQSLGINAFRIWVSYEYWREDGQHFEAAFRDFLSLSQAHGIKIMVSLFEGCGDSYSYDTVHTWSRTYTGASCGWAITSPSAAVYNNRNRWEEPKEFVGWFIGKFGSDERLMSIEIYNEPWGSNRAALAKYLCEYAVTVQGSVPLIMGTAPADEFNIPSAIALGMDQLQYHDNFPGSTSAFSTNAQSRIEQARLANLPIYCTEVQWVGGPAGINYPVYAALAETCNELMKTGKWAPFYWTLMVHPCYLNSYRNNYKMYNGLFNEDGSVNSLKNAVACADKNLTLEEKTVNPYEEGKYSYRTTFSDAFFDRHAYKWTAVSGAWSASEGVYVGEGLTLANDTDFSDFTAVFEVKAGGSAGLVLRRESDGGYLLARLDIAGQKLEIVLAGSGGERLLDSAPASLAGSSALSVTVTAAGKKVTLSCGGVSVSAETDLVSGQIGFFAEDSASFDNLLIRAS